MTQARTRKATEPKTEKDAPPEPIEVAPPAENSEATVEVDVDQAPTPPRVKTTKTILQFRQSGPEYDLGIIDELVASGRRDLAGHRDAIVDAVTSADNRSELMGSFKEDFETYRVLNMPVLNEAVNNQQTTARDLRGQLWKTIKSLPAT